MLTNSTSKYGLSSHYTAHAGRTYSDWQTSEGEIGGQLDARKFTSYITSDDVVLDFGCGGGYVLKCIPCKRRVGVEPNPYSRDIALANGVECHESLDELPDQVADIAITNHALEHVPFPIEALRQLQRKVKAGGRVVICVPLDDWRTSRVYDPTDINHHLHTWTPQLLGNTLTESGFDVRPDSVRIRTHAWPPRIHEFLYTHLPIVAFDTLCCITAFLLKHRELFAVLHLPQPVQCNAMPVSHIQRENDHEGQPGHR